MFKGNTCGVHVHGTNMYMFKGNTCGSHMLMALLKGTADTETVMLPTAYTMDRLSIVL